ncbi:MAG: SepM family pheromone-processing serine protease [Vagococcus sp.]
MSGKKYSLLRKSIIVGVILIVLLTIIPVPYYIEMPGTAENLREHVSVNGKRDKFDGSFMLTTVAVRQATLPSLITGYLNPNNDLVSKKEMMGTNSDEEYEEMQQFDMESSQNFAMKVALDLSNKPYEVDYKGVYVMSVLEESDFYHKLHVGDTIETVDGKSFKTSMELIDYIQEKQPKDIISIGVEQSEGHAEVKGKLMTLPEMQKTGIGVSLVDHTDVTSSERITFNTDDIGGPSAGLMFTLELYGLLTNKDIRRGREIAGTGTISPDGTVGRIGGIDKKVIAADNEGADLFFAPDDEIEDDIRKKYPDIKSNYEEAKESVKRNKLNLKVIPIKTAQEALIYLEH